MLELQRLLRFMKLSDTARANIEAQSNVSKSAAASKREQAKTQKTSVEAALLPVNRTPQSPVARQYIISSQVGVSPEIAPNKKSSSDILGVSFW